MATKTFNIRTEPHEAKIGDTVLLFQPEVVGAEFATEYAHFTELRKSLSDESDASIEQVASANKVLRVLLAKFMLPTSAEVFNRWDVVVKGKAVSSHSTEDAANAAAESAAPGATVVFSGMRLPERVLVEMLNWVAELYGGGAAERPTGRSSASSRSSKTTGTRGSGNSRSKA